MCVCVCVCVYIIGACRPGPTRALPGLIMFQVVLVLSKLGFTIAGNQRK